VVHYKQTRRQGRTLMTSFSGCSASVSLECSAWHTGRMASDPLAVDIARRSMYRGDVASRQRLTFSGRSSRRPPVSDAARLWLRRGGAQEEGAAIHFVK